MDHVCCGKLKLIRYLHLKTYFDTDLRIVYTLLQTLNRS